MNTDQIKMGVGMKKGCYPVLASFDFCRLPVADFFSEDDDFQRHCRFGNEAFDGGDVRDHPSGEKVVAVDHTDDMALDQHRDDDDLGRDLDIEGLDQLLHAGGDHRAIVECFVFDHLFEEREIVGGEA